MLKDKNLYCVGGYIRDEINTAATGEKSGESGSPINAGTAIHFIGEGEPDIPKESRIKGHYYIKVVKGQEAHLSTGLPRLIKVSPNMGLRMIDN